ncbi:hypothetical protein ANO11243_026390 [Dothideomycetidae sp. 11243]|nr:hypothetical protein ANO11243_026390 [fungal sp. No.11243]
MNALYAAPAEFNWTIMAINEWGTGVIILLSNGGSLLVWRLGMGGALWSRGETLEMVAPGYSLVAIFRKFQSKNLGNLSKSSRHVPRPTPALPATPKLPANCLHLLLRPARAATATRHAQPSYTAAIRTQPTARRFSPALIS